MGDLESAARYARFSLDTAHIGGDIAGAAGLTAQAMVAAHAGDAVTARRLACEAVGLFLRPGWMLPSSWPVWMLGFVELSVGDAAAAHEVLGPISQLVVASGLAEAALAPSISDDIEALVALGELDKAAELLAWLDESGRRMDRAVARAAASRCQALLLAARGDLDGAATAIATALVQHDRIPFPLERGRTILVGGRVERRRKHKTVAKRALEEALAIFDTVGATLWSQQARNELSRIGLRPSAPSELTATEDEVARLAASGLTTKQVAEQAFMSPRTVEGVLARVYQKLGVSSRAELANAIALRRSSSPPA